MAKLTVTQGLRVEDFKEQANWIDKLFYPINLFTANVISALSNNLTINENTTGQMSTVIVSTASTVTSGVGTLPNYVKLIQSVSFKWNRKASPVFLMVGNVQETSGNHTVIPYGVSLDWFYSNGQVTIQSVSGLAVSKTYNLTVLGLTG